jgi:phosphatidylinositol 4-kinase
MAIQDARHVADPQMSLSQGSDDAVDRNGPVVSVQFGSGMHGPGIASSLPEGHHLCDEMVTSQGLVEKDLHETCGEPEELVIPPPMCEMEACEKTKHSQHSVVTTCSGDEIDVSMGQSPKEWQTGGALDESDEETAVGAELADQIFGEKLGVTQQRVSSESPFAHLPTWRLVAAIVKSGDSFLQERLALQLISEMAAVFKEAGLPIRLYPYKVLIDSSLSGLIQAVPDAISIHTLKSRCRSGCGTLSNLFNRIHKDSPEELEATRRRFVNSLAGYSIVSYLMQIKDRHNGNILIDRAGHVVHIDFGFMLSNSPGSNMNFEQAPFKLTSEAVDFIGGADSNLWAYYQRLVVGGFLALRQQWQRVVQLVEMTLESHPNLPCFCKGNCVTHDLMGRFRLDASDEECEEYVMRLIEESLDHWTTWQYDSFQYMSNGILYS